MWVPTVLMLLFMGLWVSSQRMLRRAWKRETEYRIIINDLMKKLRER